MPSANSVADAASSRWEMPACYLREVYSRLVYKPRGAKRAGEVANILGRLDPLEKRAPQPAGPLAKFLLLDRPGNSLFLELFAVSP